MKHLIILIFVVLTSVSYAKDRKKSKSEKCSTNPTCIKKDSFQFKNRLDTISYFIGLQIGTDMANNGSNDINPLALQEGVADAMKAVPSRVDQALAMGFAQAYFSQKQEEKMAADLLKKQSFFETNGKRPGVKTTASGLQYEILRDTVGPKPLPTDEVSVHYTGTLLDGKVFDSSVERGEPAVFPLNRVIKGWTEGVQLMSVGAKYKFYIPGQLAYGEQGVQQAGIGPNETLVFEVELLGITKPVPTVPQAPSNLKIEGQ